MSSHLTVSIGLPVFSKNCRIFDQSPYDKRTTTLRVLIHCSIQEYARYAGEGFLLLLFLFTDKIPLTSGKIILLSLAVYPQETDYPLNNSRQTDNTSPFENGTVLILGEQSA